MLSIYVSFICKTCRKEFVVLKEEESNFTGYLVCPYCSSRRVKREYLPREEVVSRELRARVKMQEFKIDKNLGDVARVTIKSKFENRFILVQTKNYRECINLSDIYTGQVVIS